MADIVTASLITEMLVSPSIRQKSIFIATKCVGVFFEVLAVLTCVPITNHGIGKMSPDYSARYYVPF